MCGQNVGLKAMVRKKSLIIWTLSVLHRQALASVNVSEELQTLFKAFIIVVIYVKNSPL
jgi:hypothetical protein